MRGTHLSGARDQIARPLLTAALIWQHLRRMPHGMQARPSPLMRATATLGVILVLALSVMASSPELHERLHGHEAAAGGAAHHSGASHGLPPVSDGDDGCVVSLYAQGIVLCLVFAALAFTGQTVRRSGFTLVERIEPEAPGYLHLPPQAPPVG